MTPIQEVAKKANVSVATVSRVINNSGIVKQETRDRVLAAIEELNYSPNLSGRILRRNETRLVLILLPTISNPFYSRAVSGIREVADNMGYLTMICNAESSKIKEYQYLDMLKYKLADGAIIMSQEMGKDELEKACENIPIVQCFEYHESSKLSFVTIDNEKAAFEAVCYLIENGHRNIGLIGSNSNYTSALQREKGYLKALAQNNIVYDPNLTSKGNYGFKGGFNSANELIERGKNITAVFAISDMQAIGAINAFKKRGIIVPQDISVLGFDDISFSGIYDPGITTVKQPTYQMGMAAMHQLIELLQDSSKESKQIFIQHDLVIRDSTMKKS